MKLVVHLNKYTCAIILSVLVILFPTVSNAQIKIKFIVLNPSQTERQVIPVKYYLPPDIKPVDVVDTGGLTVDYDVEEGLYYVNGQVELGPKETKTFIIDVRDVWKIPEEKLALIRERAESKIASIESSPQPLPGKELADSILKRVKDIEESQGTDKPISERVESFQVNKIRIDAIENDLMVLNGITAAPEKDERIVSIRVEVQNPYAKKSDFPVRYYMPPELKESDVVDGAGLVSGFDIANNRVFLKGDVTLEPGESKKYSVKVKDVWYIKEVELSLVENEAGKILEQLVDTEYEKLGAYFANEITALIKNIRDTQKLEEPLKRRIANYKDDLQKFDTSKKYLDRLRSFLLQFELARSGSEGNPSKDNQKDVSFGGGMAEGKGGGVGSGVGSAIGKGRGQTSQQRGGGIQGIRGLKGIILVSQSVFKGWKPEVATTWFIILTIVGFLFVFAALFYLIWMVMSVLEKKKEVYGADVGKEEKKKTKKA